MIKILITTLRIIAVPILFVLYFSCIVPLSIRNWLQYVLIFMDWAFDSVAALVGWDTRFWPLPKASDELLPRQQDPDCIRI